MIDAIKKTLKTYLAQYTTLYDITSKSVNVSSNKNVLTADGLNGEFTLSGAVAGNSSIGTINNTFNFVNGTVTTDTFFGEGDISYTGITAHKVNVGTAFDRTTALKVMENTDSNNCVILYQDSTVGEGNIRQNISADMRQDVTYSIGMMVKTKASQVETLGAANMEKLFINSIVVAQTTTSSLPLFQQITERFYVEPFYVTDLKFTYEDEIFLNTNFINSLKYFDAKLSNIEVKPTKDVL